MACFDFIRTRVRTVLKSPWIFFDFECSGIVRKLLFLDFDILFLCKATLNSESPGAKVANREKLRRKVMEVQASNVISQNKLTSIFFFWFLSLDALVWATCTMSFYQSSMLCWFFSKKVCRESVFLKCFVVVQDRM